MSDEIKTNSEAEKPVNAATLPETPLVRSPEMKKLAGKKLPEKEYDTPSGRDGDGTREFAMSRYYGAAKAKRRTPEAGGFVKGIIIYAAVFLVLICILAAVLWEYLSIAVPRTARNQIETAVETYTEEDWQQFLRKYLPDSYAEYENAGELAYKVLSPMFCVKDASFLPVNGSENSFMLFSDGRHFADVSYERTDGGTFGFGSWEIGSVDFDLSFFDELNMPLTTVIIPSGAVYSINGVENPEPGTRVENTVYPGRSAGETDALENCTALLFDDIYYVPELTASLDGKSLELVADDENRVYWFKYPDSYMHTLTVTVPAEAEVTVGGKALDESWSQKQLTVAEKSGQDEGGTDERIQLAQWTVDGLFCETSVSAAVGENELTLKSSENGNYIFNIPDECTYSVTVTVPAGSTVKVNGEQAPAGSRLEKALTATELSAGHTLFGSFGAVELDTVGGCVPGFYRYVMTGFLAKPVVSVYSGDTELVPVSSSASGYSLSFEYDISESEGEDSSGIASAAIEFTELYAAFVSGGTRVQDSTDAADSGEIDSGEIDSGEIDSGEYDSEAADSSAVDSSSVADGFEAAYEALLAKTVKGSCGYRSVMENCRRFSSLAHYDVFSVDSISCTTPGYIYSDKVRVTEISARVSLYDRAEDGTLFSSGTLTLTGKLLMVFRGGEWRVWGISPDFGTETEAQE